MDEKGVPYEKRVATPEEYRAELLKKLPEEVAEFEEAHSPEELADIIEVIEALKELPEFSKVDEIRKIKLATKGGFTKRIILKGEKG
ncbi:MAG: phosphoribosyl-ATP pyrophosphohydrolase [Patescibacteria group bacterium]